MVNRPSNKSGSATLGEVALPYVGRFAPSPTGKLHFGSLVAAVGSYLQARSKGGTWLVRIEDIDPPREVSGAARQMVRDLARLGMASDQPILYQSTRLAAYEAAWRTLVADGHAFPCACSRADVPSNGIYPGNCRNGLPAGKAPRTIRVRVPDRELVLTDLLQGEIRQNLARECGEFVICRVDRRPAYQLAVVIDDAFQGVTEVVRGMDLIDSTPRQAYLCQLLGLPVPDYLHLPLVTSADGSKLSKRRGSDPLTALEPSACLTRALQFLGQNPPRLSTLDALWSWAIANWNIGNVPRSAPSGLPTNTGAPH